ncbi:hypothetical protein JDV02_002619 [Purpureocillium takamizusanense]|uniref:Uncharacterized protein n=1 Tax=Purpureocillium takamizusanense TaxID=2060973 RepID=A0A9Q8QBD0_9HYPO|nr:uncharacterized protein JDV02_002619 [Purpureocillium takamizusanense]UNI16153.1 hypothetical protein JDV02_002619 [Purpureocillium takamizusanense]
MQTCSSPEHSEPISHCLESPKWQTQRPSPPPLRTKAPSGRNLPGQTQVQNKLEHGQMESSQPCGPSASSPMLVAADFMLRRFWRRDLLVAARPQPRVNDWNLWKPSSSFPHLTSFIEAVSRLVVLCCSPTTTQILDGPATRPLVAPTAVPPTVAATHHHQSARVPRHTYPRPVPLRS